MVGNDEKHNQIEALFKDIVEHVELDDQQKQEFAQRLCNLYEEVEFRHLYSLISLTLEELRSDQRDMLVQHIWLIQACAEDLATKGDYTDEQQKAICVNTLKLCDHIDLECLRLTRIAKVEYIGKTATDELSAADGKLRETETRAKELESKVGDYHSHSIAILGIFAGLVVTISSVLQLTTSSLQNLSNVSTEKITFFIGFTFLFLFNVVFLLMYCIASITGRSLAVTCKEISCERCGLCKRNFKRFRKKYPFVYWYNTIAIVLCMILAYICK